MVRLPVHKTRSFLPSLSPSPLHFSHLKREGEKKSIIFLLSLVSLPPSHHIPHTSPFPGSSLDPPGDSLPLLACRLTPPRVGCSIATPLRRYIIHPIRIILRGYWIGLPEGKELSQEAKTNEKKERLKGGNRKKQEKENTRGLLHIRPARKALQYIPTTYYIYILHTQGHPTRHWLKSLALALPLTPPTTSVAHIAGFQKFGASRLHVRKFEITSWVEKVDIWLVGSSGLLLCWFFSVCHCSVVVVGLPIRSPIPFLRPFALLSPALGHWLDSRDHKRAIKRSYPPPFIFVYDTWNLHLHCIVQ